MDLTSVLGAREALVNVRNVYKLVRFLVSTEDKPSHIFMVLCMRATHSNRDVNSSMLSQQGCATSF